MHATIKVSRGIGLDLTIEPEEEFMDSSHIKGNAEEEQMELLRARCPSLNYMALADRILGVTEGLSQLTIIETTLLSGNDADLDVLTVIDLMISDK